MNKMKKLAFAVFAVAVLSGCATTQVADRARAVAAPAEQQVSRALPSYGSMGGYRYRRFAAVSTPTS